MPWRLLSLCLFIIVLLGPAQGNAAEPAIPEGYDCGDPLTQHEINACAHIDYLDADAGLNAQWALTAATMKQWDAEYGDSFSDGRPGFFDTLLAAQRAWLNYRDRHCASEGYLFRNGSAEPMMVSTCMARLSRERTEQLKELVETDG